MQKEFVLEMTQISKSFPGVKALDKVDLQIKAGEVHALMGENGAGKSTLMNVLCGKIKKDDGRILISGRETEIRSMKHSLESGISMIHQELDFVPALTVADNIFLGKELLKKKGMRMDKKAMYDRAKALLDEMGVNIRADARMYDLSVSQQQMIEIAKAYSNQSKIIVMDEPTSAITSEEVKVLFGLIEKLKRQDIAIIYISHKMDEIFQIADRITVLRDGQYIGCRSSNDITESELIAMMVGRQVDELFPKLDIRPGDEIFRAEHLEGAQFRDISFSLRAGEILGFAGLMGAGRTEIMRAVFGLDKLKGGKLYLHQKEIKIQSSRDAINAGIGFVSEDRKALGLILGMSIRENVTLIGLKEFCRGQFVIKRKERKITAEQIISFDIKTPGQEQKAVNLSGGNQQKLVLAKTLLSNPDIVILDEPTRGIDVGAKAEIHRMISRLASEGKGIIMISSEMPEILGMSDRIIVIHEGRVKGELTREEATQERIMETIMARTESTV